jgi:hypothetical protein
VTASCVFVPSSPRRTISTEAGGCALVSVRPAGRSAVWETGPRRVVPRWGVGYKSKSP